MTGEPRREPPAPLTADDETELRRWGGLHEPASYDVLIERLLATLDAARSSAKTKGASEDTALGTAARLLADEAARAVTEPRRFHENEDDRQQALGKRVAVMRAELRAARSSAIAGEDVDSDEFRDRHERAFREHVIGGPTDHECDDLCSAAILDRLLGKTPVNEWPFGSDLRLSSGAVASQPELDVALDVVTQLFIEHAPAANVGDIRRAIEGVRGAALSEKAR